MSSKQCGGALTSDRGAPANGEKGLAGDQVTDTESESVKEGLRQLERGKGTGRGPEDKTEQVDTSSLMIPNLQGGGE